MSTTGSNTAAASIPAAIRPVNLRAGLALAVLAAVGAFAVRVQAQAPSQASIQVRPLVGALIATGEERSLLKNAVLVGAQASYAFGSNLALVGAFGWSPSKDKTSPVQPKLDLYQYDLGIEGKLSDLTSEAPISTRPYATVGGGARTYDYRNVAGTSAQTNPLGYAALGLDLDHKGGRVGLRLEVRDNVTGFKGLRGELSDRKARNDVQLAGALTFGF